MGNSVTLVIASGWRQSTIGKRVLYAFECNLVYMLNSVSNISMLNAIPIITTKNWLQNIQRRKKKMRELNHSKNKLKTDSNAETNSTMIKKQKSALPYQ